MKDIKAIEKALLIGTVREQNWNVIIYNDKINTSNRQLQNEEHYRKGKHEISAQENW